MVVDLQTGVRAFTSRSVVWSLLSLKPVDVLDSLTTGFGLVLINSDVDSRFASKPCYVYLRILTIILSDSCGAGVLKICDPFSSTWSAYLSSWTSSQPRDESILCENFPVASPFITWRILSKIILISMN